ncbi:MAG TPA: hypothetical protein VLV50_15570 [Stellaceae bacterium]|nr:hypothetical protein [Stellaceae bacterium]
MELDRLRFPPPSRQHIEAVQNARKRLAFERALRSPYYRGRLDHIVPDRLDDPEEWSRIPVLTKDELRLIPPEDFAARFSSDAARGDVIDYWRSGGSTGKPLFYGRSAEDLRASFEGYRRILHVAGCRAGDVAHVSFPIGIHPLGRLIARAAESMGVAAICAGSGNNTPSEMQLELIRTMRPAIWLGMPSYGLQLAAMAEAQGFDLAAAGVRRLVSAAELLTAAKRRKLETLWGAEVYDHFGCAEGGPLGSESSVHDGFHLFDDLFFFEVVDETSHVPLPAGETGLLLMTPLYTNSVTPFLRWNMGDLGTLMPAGAGGDELALFPVFRHAGRTTGFFKVRGVNINHADFEEFMHRRAAILDFRVAAAASETLDELRVEVELRRDCDRAAELGALARAIRATFEVTPTVTLVEDGALARAFAEDVKAKRFVDQR